MFLISFLVFESVATVVSLFNNDFRPQGDDGTSNCHRASVSCENQACPESEKKHNCCCVAISSFSWMQMSPTKTMPAFPTSECVFSQVWKLVLSCSCCRRRSSLSTVNIVFTFLIRNPKGHILQNYVQ
jgi:hypothetical protein